MFSNIFKRQDGTEFEIRSIKDEQGEPWFVLRDACKVLDLDNTTKAAKRLNTSDLRTFTSSAGLRRDTRWVSEFGLYDLILESRKPDAREFKRWITHEVIPSIRKTGSYQTDDPMAAFPDYLRDAFVRMAEENKALKVEVEELTPLANSFKEFTDSEDTASRRDVARLLNMKERPFNDLLREWGWLEKFGSAATAKSREPGWMVNKVIQAKYGARPLQGRITPKGFEVVVRKLEVSQS